MHSLKSHLLGNITPSLLFSQLILTVDVFWTKQCHISVSNYDVKYRQQNKLNIYHHVLQKTRYGLFQIEYSVISGPVFTNISESQFDSA